MLNVIQLRRGTTSQWTSTAYPNGPILSAGEIGLNTTTKNFRVGDGSSTWSSLTDWIPSYTLPANVVLKDTNGNIQVNNVQKGYTSVTSAGTTTTLTAASTYVQRITGTSAQTIQLPDTTTLTNGHVFIIDNDSTGAVTINSSTSTLIDTVSPGALGYFFVEDNTLNTAAAWGKYAYLPGSIDWGASSVAGVPSITTSSADFTLVTPTAATASNAVTITTGTTTTGGGTSGTVTVTTGIGAGSSNSSGSLTLSTGTGSGSGGGSGNITIDTGGKSGSGTTGTITIGSTNASAITIGRSSFATTVAGTLTATPTAGTITTGATGAGYMGLPQALSGGSGTTPNTTTAYTIQAIDAGTHIYSTATRTITIPTNATLALPIGTTLTFVALTGATVTISCSDTNALLLAGTTTAGTNSRTLPGHGIATAIKITATTWMMSGNGSGSGLA